jgi:hypothetical protein
MNIAQLNNIIFMKSFLIIFLVIMWLATIGLFSEICNGQYFWYRVFAIWPFTIAMSKIINIILKYKKPVKIKL